jgi:Immune inhibitor A-like, MAM domain
VMIYNIVDESDFDPTYPSYIVGFFSSSTSEEFNRNIFFIDSYDWANRLGPDVRLPYVYEGTVAHELEHLIHNDIDAGEASWVDEGLADLAEVLNGFPPPDSHVVYYLAYHRTPLTIWQGGLESYGASFLFQLYLLENFGEKDGDGKWLPGWTLDLVQQPLDSIAGIEAQTGVEFNDLYDAWIVANYIDKPELTGPASLAWGYDTIQLTPFTTTRFSPWSILRSTKDIYGSDHKGNLPVSRYFGGYKSGTVEWPVGALSPYAPLYATYKGIEPAMNINLRGDVLAGVAPHGPIYEVASGGGNMVSDRMLVLNTPVGGELKFWTWYDIEVEWDYGFVEVSTDGGTTWAPLKGSITKTSSNPNGSTAWKNSLLGSAASSDAVITGNSGDWVEGVFTLPEASGVLVRFSYYTDESTNGQGWFIDDVSVNGFSDGFESGTTNWVLGGWQRTTGLFDNDWLAAYVDPVYTKGKFTGLDIGYFDEGVLDDAKYERITSLVPTLTLNSDIATVIISNRPRDSVFDANYRLLVDKGSASK